MSARPAAAAVAGRGLVDPAAPLVAADDEGFARGRAAFETLRVYDGRPFRLAEHLDRLVASARTARPARARPRGRAERRPRRRSPRRLSSTRCCGSTGRPGPDGDPTGIALVSAIPEWIEGARARGQRLVSLAYPRRAAPWLLPGTKSVSYATHIAAEAEAKRRGADDALLVDLDGTVLEGPVTNVWWREGRTLLTPSLELGILAGETRAALLALAGDAGYEVETGAYPLQRVLDADEVFTSSSVREVMPVVELDGVALPGREAADRLQAALRRLAGG